MYFLNHITDLSKSRPNGSCRTKDGRIGSPTPIFYLKIESGGIKTALYQSVDFVHNSDMNFSQELSLYMLSPRGKIPKNFYKARETQMEENVW